MQRIRHHTISEQVGEINAALRGHLLIRRRRKSYAPLGVTGSDGKAMDLVNALHELRATGVDLFVNKQAIDTSTSAGKALFGMLGVFAEFERDMIVERVRSGIARAKDKGKRLGRPSIGTERADKVRAELAQGTSLRVTAKRCGVSLKTVQRIKAAA